MGSQVPKLLGEGGPCRWRRGSKSAAGAIVIWRVVVLAWETEKRWHPEICAGPPEGERARIFARFMKACVQTAVSGGFAQECQTGPSFVRGGGAGGGETFISARDCPVATSTPRPLTASRISRKTRAPFPARRAPSSEGRRPFLSQAATVKIWFTSSIGAARRLHVRSKMLVGHCRKMRRSDEFVGGPIHVRAGRIVLSPPPTKHEQAPGADFRRDGWAVHQRRGFNSHAEPTRIHRSAVQKRSETCGSGVDALQRRTAPAAPGRHNPEPRSGTRENSASQPPC